MMSFRLTVLGLPDLRAPNGDPVRVRTRKHLALLIYLAVEAPASHSRDRLAALLWSGSDGEDARHSLATAVCMLRARLGPDAFDTTRDRIRLLPGVVATDIQELQRTISPDDPGDSAIGLFLDGFDFNDAPAFEQWKDAQRARLLPLLHAVLAQQIEHSRRHGDSQRMESLAQRLLRVDDLSEEATRAQLEARALSGDRIGAIRMYDKWRARLGTELGAIPAAALDRMADRLRRNNFEHPSAVMPAQVATEHWKERAFVGRRTEFAACYAIWEHVLTGEPRHMLLRGETGIGKTTLVDRFATSMALEGASVARAKCYELERELPFGAIGSLVNQLLELPGASATPPEHLAELGRLVAKVRQRYPSLPAPAQSVGETARLLLTEAVMALLNAVADEHPIVLVLDDIHLADATSLAVLHLLLRRLESTPLMAVLTSSSEPHIESPEVRRFAENPEFLRITELHVGPLPESDASSLLDALVGGGVQPGPTLRRAFLAGARGNPMVLELLVLDWRRSGNECVALSLGAMTTAARTPPEEAFRRIIEHTLVALDSESRAVAELGAILGQRLNDLGMYTLVDLPMARTMRAMTSLAAHRILRDAGNSLEFTNEFVRGQCYLAMAGSLRRLLHGAVADRLLGQAGQEKTIGGLEIAWHLVRADRLTEAVPYLLSGGRDAIRRAAPHEADIALSTGLPALNGAARRTATLLLVEAQQELGRWDESLRLLDSPGDSFSKTEESSRSVFRIIAQRQIGGLSPTDVRAATEELLTIAGGGVDPEVRAKAFAAIPPMLNITRDPLQLAVLEELLSHDIEPEVDAFRALHFLHARAWMLAVRHSSSAALDDISRAVSLAETASVSSTITVRLLLGKGGVLSGMGRYEDALPCMEAAERLARRLDNTTLQGECACGLALAHGRLGRSGPQMDWARQALARFPQTEWSKYMLSATYELGLGLVGEQRYEEAQLAIFPLTNKRPAGVPVWLVQQGLLFAADVLALSGSTRKAYRSAASATGGAMTRLLDSSCAGQFARWVALLGVRNSRCVEALSRLQGPEFDLTRLDCKDQAEVLAAIASLEYKLGANPTHSWKEVNRRLAALPLAVTRIIRGVNASVQPESNLFDVYRRSG